MHIVIQIREHVPSRCSLTGYYVTLGGSPMFWKIKKQSTLSSSLVPKNIVKWPP